MPQEFDVVCLGGGVAGESIAGGLQGSGIEPFFAIAYTRYNAKALEAIKKGETPEQKDVFFEVNPLFKEVAERNGYVVSDLSVNETTLETVFINLTGKDLRE